MRAIEVLIHNPCPAGRLIPRYDTEAEVLEVGSGGGGAWVHGVNVGAEIVFDLNKEGLLVNFDLLIPRRLWCIAPLPALPRPRRQAALVFTERTLRHKSFDLPVTVTTDARRSYVVIALQRMRAGMLWVELSPHCLAAIHDTTLHGFFVRL